jgi:hypothetical protein
MNLTKQHYVTLKELIESELLPATVEENIKDLIEEVSQAPEDQESYPWEEFERAPLLPIYNKLCWLDANSLTAQEGLTIVSPEMEKARLQLSSPDEFGNGRDRTRSVARQRMNALTSAFVGLISDPQRARAEGLSVLLPILPPSSLCCLASLLWCSSFLPPSCLSASKRSGVFLHQSIRYRFPAVRAKHGNNRLIQGIVLCKTSMTCLSSAVW